ncbi:50S ribosomal protein L13 [Petrotoga sp. 9PWA.NaAc.5.4]|uniref:50S ribosomal protein L13 n=1 Tax=Petrotoga sp. 9PWA.NaAc.5.4 TaxID=1434328 RepID=UPI000CC9C8FC|nr:50S ribosomal protein L13 [Petrotoga sp. 9PWA.NaAc.5.4]PNR97146.1 50S ribosomal protein L13 [Petrotoga sp. 9PWA.NaAc.5.4]
MNSKLVQPSYQAKKGQIKREWYLVDAEGHTLGRIASRVSKILQGKHKPIYTPHVDTGDFVIIVNADKINLSGKKEAQKVYRHYSGYPGGLKEISYEKMITRQPEKVLRLAIKGMMPKTILGKQMIKKLKIYSGPNHPHQAQNPKKIDLEKI